MDALIAELPLTLAVAVGLPFAVAVLTVWRGWNNLALLGLAAAPAMALAAALSTTPVPPAGLSLDVPWLMLGATLGADSATPVFLALTALLWLCASVAAHERTEPRPGSYRGARRHSSTKTS